MMTAFELNDDLKERCMLLGASKAVTIWFKDGVPLIPDEFWETIIVLPTGIHKNLLKIIFHLVKEFMVEFESNGFECADPVLEFSYAQPRIVYAIFPEKNSFTEKELI
jgi:hypothetical protein